MGLTTEVDDKDVWKIIENDKYLSQFLNSQEELDNTTVLSFTLSASEQLSALTKGIGLLEKELQSQIHNNYHDLISHGKWVENLEEALINMKTKIRELLSSVKSVRNKIVEPYDDIERQCNILTRLHDTSNILRCVIQVQQLAKVVQKHDDLKTSALIKEVDEFCEDIDLSGIDILENDIKLIEKQRKQILNRTRNSLMEALKDQNENQVAVCIQVFLNLNSLSKVVKTIVDSALSTVEKNTKAALDITSLMNQSTEQEKAPRIKSSGPGRVTGSTFPGVNVAAFRSKLWSNWSNLLETIIYPQCAQIYILQYVIVKHCPSSLNSESHDFPPENYEISAKFWTDVSEMLFRKLIAAADDSSFIKQALEAEYPKLLRPHKDLDEKLQKIINKMPLPSGHISKLFTHNERFANRFENAYIHLSLSRLLNCVHPMFPGDGLPTSQEIDSFTSFISNEFSVSLVHDKLCKTVVRNVGKAIQLFSDNSDLLIVKEGNASQVIDLPNAAQQLNINIANTLYHLKQQLQKIISNKLSDKPESSRNELNKEFDHVDELIVNIIDPLKNSICEAIESIILTMHQENFKIVNSDPLPPSLYLKELQAFISRAHTNYLKPFHHRQIVEKCCIDIASRCVELFLRHVCLIRPLEAGGRQRIVEDFQKIENALSPLCPEIKIIGENYKVLRSLRPLITVTDPKQISDNALLGKTIPYSLALMFLFSYAPPEIPSPHESCNWSIARLSQWLDNHKTERERLELISGALQRYQLFVKQQNKISFHEIYPIMTELLETAYKHCSSTK
ncbi:conserved oligomeric Golgi complex subunit 5 isoform X2 [Planococcus citri]|uniref:conserved oligomeric Golgi complex subunit 5 isoform X2 n=1 Tax=Planococcus citri TaxID=170843 RepID=UPI0031F944DC